MKLGMKVKRIMYQAYLWHHLSHFEINFLEEVLAAVTNQRFSNPGQIVNRDSDMHVQVINFG